jgi:hypothetical protein
MEGGYENKNKTQNKTKQTNKHKKKSRPRTPVGLGIRVTLVGLVMEREILGRAHTEPRCCHADNIGHGLPPDECRAAINTHPLGGAPEKNRPVPVLDRNGSNLAAVVAGVRLSYCLCFFFFFFFFFCEAGQFLISQKVFFCFWSPHTPLEECPLDDDRRAVQRKHPRRTQATQMRAHNTLNVGRGRMQMGGAVREQQAARGFFFFQILTVKCVWVSKQIFSTPSYYYYLKNPSLYRSCILRHASR